MTLTVNRVRDHKLIQETLGRSGVIMSAPRPVKQDSAGQPTIQADAQEKK